METHESCAGEMETNNPLMQPFLIFRKCYRRNGRASSSGQPPFYQKCGFLRFWCSFGMVLFVLCEEPQRMAGVPDAEMGTGGVPFLG